MTVGELPVQHNRRCPTRQPAGQLPWGEDLSGTLKQFRLGRDCFLFQCLIPYYHSFLHYYSMADITPGIYRHYKGGLYEVIGVGRIEADNQEVVIYKSMQDKGGFKAGSLWVRPLTVFSETVEVNGEQLPRFAPYNE